MNTQGRSLCEQASVWKYTVKIGLCSEEKERRWHCLNIKHTDE